MCEDPAHRAYPRNLFSCEVLNWTGKNLAKSSAVLKVANARNLAILVVLIAKDKMSTIVQGATTTYASRIRTGSTPLLVPSPATIAKQRSIITGTPLAPAPTLQSRPSFRSNSRMNDDDDDDDDDDDEFLDIESDEGKKDKEEDGLVEESGGFVVGPPPDALIQRRNAIPTKHYYRYYKRFGMRS